MRYRVKDDPVCLDAFYWNAPGEYVESCQRYGIPDDDLAFMIREYGYEEVMQLLEEV